MNIILALALGVSIGIVIGSGLGVVLMCLLAMRARQDDAKFEIDAEKTDEIDNGMQDLMRLLLEIEREMNDKAGDR